MDLLTAPNAGDDVRDLWKVVADLCDYVNALGGNLRIIYSDNGSSGLQLTPNNATLTLKPADGGSGGAAGLGPNWFNCAVNGQPAYVRINADVPVDTLPAGASVVNPD